jgi:hypothetical protein
MYYKIVELAATREIILHYFAYKKNRSASGLEEYCREINVYKRKNFLSSLPASLPHIVSSRVNKQLVARLNKDDNPLLLEGIHCCGILPYLNKNRCVVVRMHNDEAEYYHRLAENETGKLKKFYFRQEAKALKTFQLKLSDSIPLACVSHSDMQVLKNSYHKTQLHFIPSFTPWQKLCSPEGFGNYCLYHGNLEISENREMALWLIKHVFRKTEIQFVIAGKGAISLPSAFAGSNTRICSDPTDTELDSLIKNAHINILPSLNNTGLKLKMLHALMNGRHCMTNDAGVAGTHFHDAVIIANTPKAIADQVELLMKKPFTKEMAEQRRILMKIYNNKFNAAALNALLY